ncbi:MAG: PfaD family polyunsaturated fatty acid/polyketide biosynthesis protein [Planctomycetota bacterium]|nr:PfaD family polyunsaturated fatty acid/polyketide biosynthesis protein [Planctomycetota bacterium]
MPQAAGLATTAGETAALLEALHAVDRPFYVLAKGGMLEISDLPPETHASGEARAYVPACRPEHLGDTSFCRDLGLRYPYLTGAMANGIGSVEIVEAMGRAGMLGFFGAAGLSLERIEAVIERLQSGGNEFPCGFNLIHTPNEPRIEAAVVDLYLRRGVRLVEASAYLDLTLPLVRYRVKGLRRGPDGEPLPLNRIVAKVSRVEVAAKFFAPPPERLLKELVAQGEITEDQARLAARMPMAQDLTAEADSGGHTDNRPAIALLPTMLALRDRMQAQYGFGSPLRVGAAGGISTPASAAAMYAMGAAWVLTGSVNQACVESGSSDRVRAMLAEAQQADVAMAPAADMFEMGVKLQVLKRGTMFPMRAAKLYQLYRTYESLEALPAAERATLEQTVFRAPLDEIWAQTRSFFLQRDPSQVERAEREPRHKLALVFRWYLGMSSRWANAGEASRAVDYQVWCGPAMGAFNEWAKGSCLERPERRRVVAVALNILYGAAVLTRVHALRCQGVAVPPGAAEARPLEFETLAARLNSMRNPT